MACILFVDDDPLTLKMLTKIAELDGHETLTAGSGQEALEQAARGQPDMIFLDMMMGDMDGLTLLRTLREQAEFKNTPVVMLSAGFELDAAEQAQAAGAQAYLNKPISMDALRKVIGEYGPR